MYTLENTIIMKNNKACTRSEQKLSIKKAISVYHVGDKEVRGVKAAINKIVQSLFQKSFKSRYMIYNL